MKEPAAQKDRVRKEYSKKEGRTQKMMSFRVDNDNAEFLCTKRNKGRYINELIRKDREESGA